MKREKVIVINRIKVVFTAAAILFIPYSSLISLCGLDYFNPIFLRYCQRYVGNTLRCTRKIER